MPEAISLEISPQVERSSEVAISPGTVSCMGNCAVCCAMMCPFKRKSMEDATMTEVLPVSESNGLDEANLRLEDALTEFGLNKNPSDDILLEDYPCGDIKDGERSVESSAETQAPRKMGILFDDSVQVVTASMWHKDSEERKRSKDGEKSGRNTDDGLAGNERVGSVAKSKASAVSVGMARDRMDDKTGVEKSLDSERVQDELSQLEATYETAAETKVAELQLDEHETSDPQKITEEVKDMELADDGTFVDSITTIKVVEGGSNTEMEGRDTLEPVKHDVGGLNRPTTANVFGAEQSEQQVAVEPSGCEAESSRNDAVEILNSEEGDDKQAEVGIQNGVFISKVEVSPRKDLTEKEDNEQVADVLLDERGTRDGIRRLAEDVAFEDETEVSPEERVFGGYIYWRQGSDQTDVVTEIAKDIEAQNKPIERFFTNIASQDDEVSTEDGAQNGIINEISSSYILETETAERQRTRCGDSEGEKDMHLIEKGEQALVESKDSVAPEIKSSSTTSRRVSGTDITKLIGRILLKVFLPASQLGFAD